MSALPVAEVRSRLSKLIDEATATHQRVEITRNGRRAAVLLSADDYLDADQLAHAMRDAVRS
jgi:antitoxin YefM